MDNLSWDIGDVVFEGRFRFFKGDSGILITIEPDRLLVGSLFASRLTLQVAPCLLINKIRRWKTGLKRTLYLLVALELAFQGNLCTKLYE